MESKKLTLGCCGRPGVSEEVPPEWVGWSGQVAHPDSPQGGGGPGFFAPTGGSEREDDSNPWQPGRVDELGDLPKPPSRRANAPPATRARSLGVLKHVQGDNIDVDIEGVVLDDTGGGPSGSAKTNFQIPALSSPGYAVGHDGKITKFKGKLTWKGKLTIQTHYGDHAHADQVSCYGRGTTEEDVRAGDVTLGFHESRHQVDFVAFLQSHPLPDPPPMVVGVTPAAYEKVLHEFTKAYEEYPKQMNAESFARTDEVGFPKSLADSQRKCFVHHVLPSP
jgi:hypothetical protein